MTLDRAGLKALRHRWASVQEEPPEPPVAEPCEHPEHVLVCAICGTAIAFQAGALDEVIDRLGLLPDVPAEAPA